LTTEPSERSALRIERPLGWLLAAFAEKRVWVVALQDRLKPGRGRAREVAHEHRGR